jgi:hypothetical protein
MSGVGHALLRLPVQGVSLLCLVAAVFEAKPFGITPWRNPGFEIPRSWARSGHVLYSGIFGALLGLQLITTIPSLGVFVLIA